MKRVNLFLFLMLGMSSMVLASTGVSPSYYEVNYKPLLEEEYAFNFFFDSGNNVEFEIFGDLADYATIKSQKRNGNIVTVIVKLSLPRKVDVPGLHTLRVSGKEIIEASGGISLNLNVKGLIWIRVPYPSKYAELDFSSGLVNQGDSLPYELTVYSRGEEDITIKPKIQLYSLQGELVDEFSLSESIIKSAKEKTYSGELDTGTYFPGDYNLNAVVEYDIGKIINKSILVRLGELKVKIINYTSTFEKDKLNHFKIEVESLWNDPLENVYADVSVMGYPLKNFVTPSLKINPWSKRTLSGVLDSTDITEESLQLKITVNYEDKTTSQIVNVSKQTKGNPTSLFIILGVIIFLLIIIGLVFYIIKIKNEK